MKTVSLDRLASKKDVPSWWSEDQKISYLEQEATKRIRARAARVRPVDYVEDWE